MYNKKMLSPISIGKVEIKNRLVSSPTTANYASPDGIVTEQLLKFYDQKAASGVGLVIVEGSYISQEGKGYVYQIGIDRDETIAGLSSLADTIKKHGCKVFMQIQHCGRRSKIKLTGLQPIGASAVPYNSEADVPREMTNDEIEETIKKFAEAAKRAQSAGFDGIDIHSAHGYLPANFLSPLSNFRTDKWGGSIENRSRFLVEVVKAIKSAVGKDFPVTIKISVDEYQMNGLTLNDSAQLVKFLEDAGADGIQASAGAPGDNNLWSLDNPHTFMRTLPLGTSQGCLVYLAEELKKHTDLPVIALGRINTPELAEEIISNNKADLVALGRPLLADPQWVNKAAAGKEETIRPCIGCNQGCYTKILKQEKICCAVNAEIGLVDKELIDFTQTVDKKKILIVGGGVSGMECARLCSMKGHEVILLEKTDKLGGQINIASVPPDRGELVLLVKYLERELTQLKVDIRLNTELTMDLLEDAMPDILICATGAHPREMNQIDFKDMQVLYANDVLAGKKFDAQHVLIVGAGLVGCETADYLAQKGLNVSLVEIMGDVALDALPEEREFLKKKFERFNVKVFTNSRISGVNGESVDIVTGDETYRVKANAAIISIGSQATLPEVLDLSSRPAEIKSGNKEVKVFYIGDCVKPRRVIDAIHSAYDAAREIIHQDAF
ncbi:MAG: 2,4-dienoyl-CoA reductase [NADPH] [Firmicutes bacterium]|nr:2,4-dienoyl-CoA reductase [NADPH] [Bacillota bacterium]MDI6705872.1 FAD-dependent oxidoreductase [Bacillota bacterium]